MQHKCQRRSLINMPSKDKCQGKTKLQTYARSLTRLSVPRNCSQELLHNYTSSSCLTALEQHILTARRLLSNYFGPVYSDPHQTTATLLNVKRECAKKRASPWLSRIARLLPLQSEHIFYSQTDFVWSGVIVNLSARFPSGVPHRGWQLPVGSCLSKRKNICRATPVHASYTSFQPWHCTGGGIWAYFVWAQAFISGGAPPLTTTLSKDPAQYSEY